MQDMQAAPVHPFQQAGLGKAPFQWVGVEERRGPLPVPGHPGMFVGSPGQPMGVCDFCGTGIAECHFIRSSDGRTFMVGCECVRKTYDAGLTRAVKEATAKKRRERTAAKKRMKREEREAARRADGIAFLRDTADVLFAAEWGRWFQSDSYRADGPYGVTDTDRPAFVADILSKVLQWGAPSDRQREAVANAVHADAVRHAEKVLEAQVRKTVAPLAAGRQRIVGTVIAVKLQHGTFGASYKWMVKDAAGRRFWGSVPSALEFGDFTEPGFGDSYRVVRKAEVAFDADVQPKESDFAFYSRPSKAERLEPQGV